MSEESNHKYTFFGLMIGYTIMVIWAAYDFGYNDARYEYSRPVKYRCHDGLVYKSTQGYWEKSNQSCKQLEEIK